MKLPHLSIGLVVITLVGCIYHAGNIGSILTFSSNIKSEVSHAVSDSLRSNGNFSLPQDFSMESFTDHDHLDLEHYYFRETPKEVYLVTYEGSASIRYLYSFEKDMWYNNASEIPEEELIRIKKRFLTQVLEEIRDEAINLGLNDKEIYVDIDRCGNDVICHY
ncbi:hypothetical protein [Halocola ammonii]